MKTKLFFNLATILLLALFVATTQQSAAQGVKTIVIDPGHGGSFPGAQYGGHTEKSINLNVALKLSELLKKRHPEVKVILTRTKDVTLGKSLREDLAARSKIANDAEGDLFISIHANAASNTSASGAETIIMGESSLEKQRNDAALYTANRDYIIDMSDEKTAAIVRAYIQNLQFTYGQYSEALARLIQKSYGENGRKVRELRRQPIMVLYGTDMPCVLTEIGFMSNAAELAYMTSAKGSSEIAESIYKGIDNYITMVNRTATATPPTTTTTTKQSTKNSPPQATTQGYTIQILSSGKSLSLKDSQFKSHRGKVWEKITSGSYKYKYCIGKYKSQSDASKHLKDVKKSFKDAFVTTY